MQTGHAKEPNTGNMKNPNQQHVKEQDQILANMKGHLQAMETQIIPKGQEEPLECHEFSTWIECMHPKGYI